MEKDTGTEKKRKQRKRKCRQKHKLRSMIYGEIKTTTVSCKGKDMNNM